ncbi:TetR family transcriptional regulator [Rhodococcus phenolicus]|uniref:TetR/AcrR family transcriptional regulator n=1 Tax=Rhodococcus phenolicus TaxID=263849 RepID=UPI000832294A|nr:TetR family transcriptional regulator [Rhodococcus phenolicus]
MTGTRPGRRPGNSGSRERILESARELFATNGFGETTIRSIAARAEVDAALVHHYFGSKHALFAASIALPVDPYDVLAPVRDGPVDEIGPRLASALLGVWDSPHRDAIVAVFRTVLGGSGDIGLLRTFLLDIVFDEIVPRVDHPAGTGPLRVELVASQMAGLMVTRYLLRLEPLASLPADSVVGIVGPTLQRYLTGELDRPNRSRR